MSRIRVELHSHTYWSPDCGVKPDTLLRNAQRKGLGAIAITDHNQIGGAFEARDLGILPVIVGEEIKTNQGELLAYFLEEFIPSGMSVADTVKAITEQSGIISVPHPFDRYRSSAIDHEALVDITDHLDMIEIFNSRNLRSEDNDRAREFQKRHRVIPAVGSDAHSLIEIGRSYQEIDTFDGAREFLAAMDNAKLITRKSSVLIHYISTYQRLKKRFTGQARPTVHKEQIAHAAGSNPDSQPYDVP